MKKHTSYSTLRSLTVFLRVAVVLIGVIALVLMLVEPHFEGRNAHASVFQIYFNDLFLAYVYMGSIPFFVALFQAFKLFGLIGQDKMFSRAAVRTLKIIKLCAFITAGAIVAAIVYLRIAASSSGDDSAGAIMLGNIAILASLVVGSAAAVFEKTLQNAVDIKSENDLTV